MATERFIRWFQFHALTPAVRIDGDRPAASAPWSLPSAPHPVLLDYVALRYQLLPYIRAVARLSRTNTFPAMRSLADEFPDDAAAPLVRDQFMLGPSLLVSPVLAPGATTRSLYLPGCCEWFDFWTGAAYAGGQQLRMPAPPAVLPLFVKAGTILPCALPPTLPDSASGATELRVYAGRDARLELAGPGPAVGVAWDDAARTIKIDATRAASADARSIRVLHLTRVRPGHGVGLASARFTDLRVTHAGEALRLLLPAPPAPPAAPRGLLARATRGRIELSWQPVPGAVVYRLKRSTRAGGPYLDVASSLTTPAHEDKSIRAGQTYHYVVTAIHAGGESAPSAEAGALIRSLLRADVPRLDPPFPPARLGHGGHRARSDQGNHLGPLGSPGLPVLAAHHLSSP